MWNAAFGRDQNTAARFLSHFLSRPQGGDPPNLNSELFTLNSYKNSKL